jgi:hypothetical protein
MANRILGQSRPAGTTDTTLFTCWASLQAEVKSIVITNTWSAPANATVNIVAVCGSVWTNNQIINAKTIQVWDTLIFDSPIGLSAWDIINVKSSVASTLTFQAFGDYKSA